MNQIVEIRFKKAGRIHTYLDQGLELKPGEKVIVETSKGLELGWVVSTSSKQEEQDKLKPILRRATAEDLQRKKALLERQKETLLKAGQIINSHSFPMKLLATEYDLEGNHLTVYFSAESRLDFQEISRKLSEALKVKIELRQVGPRDAAKLMGGCGPCGRTLCCALHLCEFEPVSIKMAKVQDLPLTPIKISGVCGRLLCCLSYEYPSYQAVAEKMPRKGQKVITPSGEATVVERNLLKETVTVETEDQTLVELDLSQVTLPAKGKEPAFQQKNDTDLSSETNQEASQ